MKKAALLIFVALLAGRARADVTVPGLFMRPASGGYNLQPATVTPNFALGLSASTGVFTSTLQVGSLTPAAPGNPTITLHYGAGGNGDYFALGNSFGFSVVPYKIVNGRKLFGTGSAQYSVDDNNSGNNLWITFSWDAVPGVDGYRVFIQDTVYLLSNYNAYYDTTLTQANLGKAGAPPGGAIENSVSLGTTQTPIFVPLTIDQVGNVNTPGGMFTISGLSAFFGVSAATASFSSLITGNGAVVYVDTSGNLKTSSGFNWDGSVLTVGGSVTTSGVTSPNNTALTVQGGGTGAGGAAGDLNLIGRNGTGNRGGSVNIWAGNPGAGGNNGPGIISILPGFSNVLNGTVFVSTRTNGGIVLGSTDTWMVVGATATFKSTVTFSGSVFMNTLTGGAMTIGPTTSLTINMPSGAAMTVSNNVPSGSNWPEIRTVNQANYVSGFALDRSGGSGVGAPGGEWLFYRYGSGGSDNFCIGMNGQSEPFCISPGSGGGVTIGAGHGVNPISSGLRVAGEAVFGDGSVSPTAVLDTYPNGIVFGTGIISDDSNGNITGFGTSFTSEVQVGDVLFDTADSEYATVINIISDTSLTVFPAFPDAVGTTFQILPPTFAAHRSDLGLGGGEPAQMKTWQNGFTGMGTMTPVNGYNSKIAFELFGNGGAMVRFGANTPGSGKIRVFQYTNNGDSVEYFDQSIDSSGNPSFDLPNGKQFCFDSTPNSIAHILCTANNGQLSSAANTAGRVIYTVAGGLAGADYKDSANFTFNGTAVGIASASVVNESVANINISSSEVHSSTYPQTVAVSTNNVNNWNVGTSPVVYASFTVAGSSITGISGGAQDVVLTVVNSSTVTINVPNESTNSTAANRFLTTTGGTIPLAPNEWMTLYFDAKKSRWRVRK